MKRLELFVLGWFLVWTVFLSSEPLQLEVAGEAAILMNADSGVILFEKGAHQQHYPASTTKVATALYALKKKGKELKTVVVASQEALVCITPEAKRKANYTCPAYWNETDGTHIALKKDEEMSFYDLLQGLLISSGNDAANVLAQSIGGTIPQFMVELNQFLQDIGCQETYFCNPHGLHHPDHVTTAYDLALMTKEALKESTFCSIVSQTRFLRPKTNKQKSTTLAQSNRLLRPGKFYYSKAIGVKTGYHAKAKHNFVAAARMGDRTLIAVLMACPQRNQIFQDAIKLFDAAFNQPKVQRVFLKAGPQKFTQTLPHADREVQPYLQENLSLEYYPAEDPQVKCLLTWESLSLPIQKDQKVGELQLVTPAGEVVKTASLWASEEVNLTWPYSWLHLIGDFFN